MLCTYPTTSSMIIATWNITGSFQAQRVVHCTGCTLANIRPQQADSINVCYSDDEQQNVLELNVANNVFASRVQSVPTSV